MYKIYIFYLYIQISKLLVLDPEKRFSAEDCLKHPWLEGVQVIYDRVNAHKVCVIDPLPLMSHWVTGGQIYICINFGKR